MISRRLQINRRLHQLLDAVLLALTFYFAHLIRFHAPALMDVPQIPVLRDFLWIMAIIVPITPIVLEMHGYYHRILHKTIRDSLRQFVHTLLWVGLMVSSCVVFLKYSAESRSVLLIFMAMAAVVLLLKEQCIKVWMFRGLRLGRFRKRVILAGPQEDLEHVLQRLPAIERYQMRVVGRVDVTNEPVSRLPELFRQTNAERVIIAADHMHFGAVEKTVNACETEGVEAWLSTEFLNNVATQPRFDVLGDQPMLVFRMTSENYTALLAKDILDRAIAAVILLLVSPLLLFAALGIRIASPGAPVIFRQERGGRYGQPFRMFKFRTMCPDADSPEMRRKVERMNELQGPAFKLTNDPRIFSFGQFLRSTSIDELPQLLNVLRGEMSLVGPRPLPVYQVEKIDESRLRRRLSVKPGLTCLWQISGRNRITDFEKWVELDLNYIDNWSLWLDLKILFRTIPVVFSGEGAR